MTDRRTLRLPPSFLRLLRSDGLPGARAAIDLRVLTVGLLTVLAVTGCGARDEKRASAPAAPSAAQALPVAVLDVQPRRLPVTLESVARAEGSREVEIRARVTGILEKQLFQEGEPVRAGAPLYRIDAAPFEIALAQARAALEQERARLERAQIESTRARQLVGERAISQREYDDATASLRQARASVLGAQARVREAELNLSYTRVNAPISGVAGRSLRSEGSLVAAGTESALLTTLVRTNPVWVRFSLSEPEYAMLRRSGESGRVRLVLADGSIHPGAGRLNFAGSTVDAKLGTVQLRAEFPNPSGALLPGQFVRARIEAGEQEGVLVPHPAVMRGDQGQFVWVVSTEGKAIARPVTTSGWAGDDWVVSSGLAAGDRVIVDNLIKVRPGAAVQPKPAQTPSARESAAPTSGAGADGSAPAAGTSAPKR